MIIIEKPNYRTIHWVHYLHPGHNGWKDTEGWVRCTELINGIIFSEI